MLPTSNRPFAGLRCITFVLAAILAPSRFVDAQPYDVIRPFSVGDAGGGHPGGLIQATDGNFYGFATNGPFQPVGHDSYGTLFRLTSGSAITVLHTFHGGPDD